jgi:hypothetical protein
MSRLTITLLSSSFMRASIWMEASHYLIRGIGMKIEIGLFTGCFKTGPIPGGGFPTDMIQRIPPADKTGQER